MQQNSSVGENICLLTLGINLTAVEMRDRFEVVVLGKLMKRRNFNNTVKPFNLVAFQQICTPFSLSILYYLPVSYSRKFEGGKKITF